MTLAAVKEKINEIREETNIKDNTLRKKLELLMNNICVQKLDNDSYVFFKHFASKKKGVIYQLLISGDSFDGIYEFKVFGHNVNFKNKITEDGVVVKIETTSNFDLAEFDVKDITTTIKMIDELQFKRDFNKIKGKLINYDIILVYLKNEIITINSNIIGEVKTKKQIRELLRNNKDIVKMEFIEKKKKHYISKIDLGEQEFKRQLLELNLLSQEEYELYTKCNDKIFSEIQSKFKKVEIIY